MATLEQKALISQWRIRPVMAAQEENALITQWHNKPVMSKNHKVRSRNWAPKVRSGCRVCKQRKLKCGEERPSCDRCVKAGFNCEYVTPKAWVFESSATPCEESSSPSSHNPHAGPSACGDRLDVHEQRALVYFREKTVPILSSFAHGSAHFWTKIVPRLSLTNPTVRSAMIAASSLHENVHYRGRSLQPAMFPEKLYAKHLSKSIGALTIRDQPPSREVVLMTCLLFLACENLKQSSAAQLHVQSGLKVLREWKQENEKTSCPKSYVADSMHDVVENTLEPIFARLEAQISLLKQPAEQRGDFHKYDLNWQRPALPETFLDLFSARDCVHDIVQWFFYQSRLSGGPLVAENPSYRAVARFFEQWNQVFLCSFPQCDERDWPSWSAAAALRVHVLALTLALHAEAIDSVIFWDQHIDDVEWMLRVCSDIITSGPPPTDQPDSLWLYDFCLSPPLLLCAINCRHPVLRRRAITLMRVQHCWNNDEPSDACWSAKFCELIVSIEEAGLTAPLFGANDIPGASRIRPLMIWLGDPGKIKIFYNSIGNATVRQHSLDWDLWTKPVLETLFMYPFGEMVKYGQFQGLIRPARISCMCKTYGAPVAEEWSLQA